MNNSNSHISAVEALQTELLEEKDKGRLAFVLGNGINRYANNSMSISWESLMRNLWQEAGISESFPEIKQGLSLVEKYDIMCVKMDDAWKDILKANQGLVKKTFSQGYYLESFQKQLLKLHVPVLTTNYDNYLEKDLKKYLNRIGSDAKAWYICSLRDLDEGKIYFLRNVGINIVIIENFDVRYRTLFDF